MQKASKITKIFVSALLGLIFYVPALAQEGGLPDMETSNSTKSTKEVIRSEGEPYSHDDLRLTNTPSASKESAKDSAAITSPLKVQPKINRVPENKPAKEGEDVLSFNFLYFIFQKFKLSDIIE